MDLSSMLGLSHLKCHLTSETKTFHLEFLPETAFPTEIYFTPALLEDLEKIFSWLSHHSEIFSVVLSSSPSCSLFGRGLHPFFHKEYSVTDLNLYLKKWQRLIFSLFFLPQTLILDLKKGSSNIFSEFSLGADIRVAHHDAQINFNHLKEGLVPCSGGIGFLSLLFSPSLSRTLILGMDQNTSFLKNIGFLSFTYDKEEEKKYKLDELLKSILAQGQVERIQAKRSLLEVSLLALEKAQEEETQFAMAAHSFGDWKEFFKAQEEKRDVQYIGPQMASQLLKKIDKLSKQDYSTLI